MKSYTLQIIRVWNDGISLGDQRDTPVLLSPRNARGNVLRHDRVCATSLLNLCGRDATEHRPWQDGVLWWRQDSRAIVA